MILSERILGSSVVKDLQAHTSAPLLRIGTDQYTRVDLATVACFNFHAAVNLNNKLQEFKVKNTKDLFHRISPADLAMPGLGAISLAVLGAVFQTRNFGGDSPLETWASRHQQNGDRGHALVTFNTMKHRSRDMKADRAEKRATKRRRQKRREQAHETRVERFETRMSAADKGAAS